MEISVLRYCSRFSKPHTQKAELPLQEDDYSEANTQGTF